MQRVRTYAASSQVASADLNGIQDNAAPASGAWGTMVGGYDLYSLDGATLVVPAIDAITMGATGVVLSTPGASFTPASVGTTVVANTWYYLYAYNNAGAIAWEVSTTAPDVARVFKSGDTSRRYIGPFHTYGGSTPIRQFNYSRGVFSYRFSAMTSAEANPATGLFALLNDTTTSQVTYANLNLDDFVTPGAQWVDVLCTFKGSSVAGNIGTMSLNPSGDAGTEGSQWTFQCVPGAAGDYREFPKRCGVGSYNSGGTHRGLAYKFGSGAGSGVTGNILVTGFIE